MIPANIVVGYRAHHQQRDLRHCGAFGGRNAGTPFAIASTPVKRGTAGREGPQRQKAQREEPERSVARLRLHTVVRALGRPARRRATTRNSPVTIMMNTPAANR